MAGRIADTREVRPMGKKLLVVCVVLLLAAALSPVKAAAIHSALYDWWYDPATGGYATQVTQTVPIPMVYWVGTPKPGMEVYVQVWEKVLLVEPGVYEYTYTVHNELLDVPSLWCWGFEDTQPMGYIANTWQSPHGGGGWNDWQGATGPINDNPYNCAWDAGVQAGWITQTYSAPGILVCTMLDEFKYQSIYGPLKDDTAQLYLAYAHDDRANPGEPNPWKAKGWISGPVPEPGTLILLGIGALGFLPFFRRKKK